MYEESPEIVLASDSLQMEILRTNASNWLIRFLKHVDWLNPVITGYLVLIIGRVSPIRDQRFWYKCSIDRCSSLALSFPKAML